MLAKGRYNWSRKCGPHDNPKLVTLKTLQSSAEVIFFQVTFCWIALHHVTSSKASRLGVGHSGCRELRAWQMGPPSSPLHELHRHRTTSCYTSDHIILAGKATVRCDIGEAFLLEMGLVPDEQAVVLFSCRSHTQPWQLHFR